MDDYKTVVENMRRVGETARQFNVTAMVEFVRSSTYMSALTTALKTIREAAHPNLGRFRDGDPFEVATEIRGRA